MRGQLFEMLQDYLGEDSEAGIVAYVRRHRLMLGRPPALWPEEGRYFAPPWHLDHMTFRLHAPRDLRDCTHWEVVLRLIAAANYGSHSSPSVPRTGDSNSRTSGNVATLRGAPGNQPPGAATAGAARAAAVLRPGTQSS